MRRTTKIASLLTGIGAGVVAVVWLLRDRLMGPEALPAAPPRPPAFRVVKTPSPRRTDADEDLMRVKGIGPAYRARLMEVGITRFADLAAADPALVAEAAGVPEARASEWVEQARELAG